VAEVFKESRVFAFGATLGTSMRRAWWKIGIGVGVAALLALLLAFGPIVRAKAAAQAERRGARLEVGSVRAGLGRVWLRDVKVSIPDIPALELQLDAIEVRLSAGLGVKSVRAHGGNLVLRGEPASVARQIEDWRAKLPQGSEGGGGSTTYSVDGVSVEWQEIAAGAEPQRAWGVRVERNGQNELLSADLVRARIGGVVLELGGASVSLVRRDGRRALERITAGQVIADVDLDSEEARRIFRDKDLLAKTEPAKAVPGKPASKDAISEWNIERFIDPSRAQRVKRHLQHAAAILSDALPESGELDLDGVQLRARHGKEHLNVGPAHLSLSRGEKSVAISLTTAATAEHALKLALDLPFGHGDVTARIEGGPASLAALGVQNGNLGLQKVDKATLEARGTATLSADGSRLSWSGLIKLAHVSMTKSWLARDPVEGLDLALRGRGSLGLDGTWLRIEQGDLDVGKIRIELKGSLEQSADPKKKGAKRLVLEGGVPLASCQSLLDSLPKGLAPLLDGMQMGGTFALAGKLELDTSKLDKMTARYSATNECRITRVPADVSPRKFQQSWARQVLSADGKPTVIQSGPGTPGWVPRDAISRHMETAVLIQEDGAFFRHKGFDDEAIQNSLRENIKAGHFVRGASTISMQLAKNLYLPREKTLSRKLQEAVLTMLLEQELTKDQIMELYLNVIEYGPGLYGVGPAANHYFNTGASRLSLGQAMYLGSILPNPKRQYFGADGAVTPGWTSYLRKLMRIAVKIRRVSESELEEGLVEQVKFKVPYAREVADDEPGVEDEANLPGVPPPPPM
jgi:hypothetical protein